MVRRRRRVADLLFHLVAGAGFEPATSGQDLRPVPDYNNSRVPLENLGLLRRFSVGRLELYRNAMGRLPVVSDDISMTCRIHRPVGLTGPRGDPRNRLRADQRADSSFLRVGLSQPRKVRHVQIPSPTHHGSCRESVCRDCPPTRRTRWVQPGLLPGHDREGEPGRAGAAAHPRLHRRRCSWSTPFGRCTSGSGRTIRSTTSLLRTSGRACLVDEEHVQRTRRGSVRRHGRALG